MRYKSCDKFCNHNMCSTIAPERNEKEGGGDIGEEGTIYLSIVTVEQTQQAQLTD